MSIVYDYLKQIHAQKETKKDAPQANAQTPSQVPSPAVPPVKKSFRTPLWLMAAVFILGCLLVGAGLFFFPPKVEKTTVKVYQGPVKAQKPAAAVSDEGLILEGIIYNPSRPFAIINGKMLEAGGRIGDFEATQITADSVLLKNLKDGTSRTIRL
jgi:hypothetical protein